VINSIPKEIELVLWDYYHKDIDFYKKFIDLHRTLNKEPIASPAAWDWGFFWANLPIAYSTIGPFMDACKEKKVKQAFITTWGYDGVENDIYSVLPAFQFFSECAYSKKINKNTLKSNFYGVCGVNIESFNLASGLDYAGSKEKRKIIDVSRYLLWDDPFIGLCEPIKSNQSFKMHYKELHEKLKKEINRNTISNRLVYPSQISRILAIKSDLRKDLVSAYRSKNRKKIKILLEKEVKPLLKEVKKLWKIHRNMWLITYKPFGLEVIEIRYGGLTFRLQSLIDRIGQYINKEIKDIPEFETKLLKLEFFEKDSWKRLHYRDSYRRIITSSANS